MKRWGDIMDIIDGVSSPLLCGGVVYRDLIILLHIIPSHMLSQILWVSDYCKVALPIHLVDLDHMAQILSTYYYSASTTPNVLFCSIDEAMISITRILQQYESSMSNYLANAFDQTLRKENEISQMRLGCTGFLPMM